MKAVSVMRVVARTVQWRARPLSTMRVENVQTIPNHIKFAKVKAQVSQATFSEVPILDFAPFRSGDAAAKAETAQNLLAAFKDIGFVTLINHGLPDELNKRTFKASADVFALSIEEKKKYAWVSPESNRGWLQMGQELLDGDAPDLKETFEIGNEAETTFANQWPEEEL